MEPKLSVRMLSPEEPLAGQLPEVIRFAYRSEFFFEVDARTSAAGFGWNLIRRVANPPIVKEHKWMPFEDHVDSPRGYVASFGNEPVGYVEFTYEEWSRLVRIWHLYVHEGHRGQGVGRVLIDTVKTAAKHFKARGIILETQSCNAPAIAFYQRLGFTFWGLNTGAYSNQDIKNHDVFLWLGLAL